MRSINVKGIILRDEHVVTHEYADPFFHYNLPGPDKGRRVPQECLKRTVGEVQVRVMWARISRGALVAFLLIGLTALSPYRTSFRQRVGLVKNPASIMRNSAEGGFKPPAGSSFGTSVGLHNQVAIVGTGADGAYIFRPSGHGSWHHQATLLNPYSRSDGFGSAVAISAVPAETYAVVGAWGGGNDSNGVAYVFRETGAAWRLQATLRPADKKLYEFGARVVASGDTIAVSTEANKNNIVYIWSWSHKHWRLRAELINPGHGDDAFGAALAASADTIVIGAPNNNGGTPGSAAYVYVRRADGTWALQAKLTAPRKVSDFGISVATSGSVIVVGAFGPSPGFAFVYRRSGRHWYRVAELTQPSSAVGDAFGLSVAISGARIIASDSALFSPEGRCGGAYEFVRVSGAWKRGVTINGNCRYTGAGGAQFGWASALSGRTALFGAPGANNSAGGAYIVKLP